MRDRLSAIAVIFLPVTGMISACSTVYVPPKWEPIRGYTESQNVKAQIDEYLKTYTSAMRELAGGQDFGAVLTILTAIGGTTALALGAGTDVGILVGSAGAGITQTMNYAKPHERLQLLGQAVNATTCVRDEFSRQAALGSALRTALRMPEGVKMTAFTAPANSEFAEVSGNNYLARQVDHAGEIAIDATRAISTSLQVKLINVSQVPDYAATVKAIQDAQKAADASKPNSLNGVVEELVDEVSEYEKRIETCKGKLPS